MSRYASAMPARDSSRSKTLFGAVAPLSTRGSAASMRVRMVAGPPVSVTFLAEERDALPAAFSDGAGGAELATKSRAKDLGRAACSPAPCGTMTG